MSSVVISGNTSGTITLDAPAVAGTTTLTLPATSGTVVTKDTNGIISVNGVQFPATQSASADANCLDDYEEGTWTSTLTNCGGSATVSSTNYVKIGNVVTARIAIASGTYTLNSSRFTLPFTSVALQTGTFAISTSRGGFLEAQASNLCYFATSDSGGVNCTITYITS